MCLVLRLRLIDFAITLIVCVVNWLRLYYKIVCAQAQLYSLTTQPAGSIASTMVYGEWLIERSRLLSRLLTYTTAVYRLSALMRSPTFFNTRYICVCWLFNLLYIHYRHFAWKAQLDCSGFWSDARSNTPGLVIWRLANAGWRVWLVRVVWPDVRSWCVWCWFSSVYLLLMLKIARKIPFTWNQISR